MTKFVFPETISAEARKAAALAFWNDPRARDAFRWMFNNADIEAAQHARCEDFCMLAAVHILNSMADRGEIVLEGRA